MSEIFFDELKRAFATSQRRTRKMLKNYANCVFNEGYDTHSPSIYIKEARGCHLEDYDGNVYIDTALGAGTAILGHANPLIVELIRGQLPQGTLFAAPTLLAHEFSELLRSALPWFGGFAFCNTGTEATMRAVRIARAVTGREKIGMFSGGWHGNHDLVLVEEDYNGRGDTPTPRFRSAGIPQDLLDHLVFLPFNSPDAFRLIRAHADELAAILIEPSQGSNPRDDLRDFLQELRRVTAELGILLCFDEIITGFRLALGGAQELYGVQADLATYGKIIGGGAPIGLVAGRLEIMRRIRGGNPKDPLPVFMGGTFSANPITMATGIGVVRYLLENADYVYDMLNRNACSLKDQVNAFCVSENIQARMMGIGSMLRLVFTDHPISSRRERDGRETSTQVQRFFRMAMLLSKVYTAENGILFLSTSHDTDVVKAVIEAFQENLWRFARHGAWSHA